MKITNNPRQLGHRTITRAGGNARIRLPGIWLYNLERYPTELWVGLTKLDTFVVSPNRPLSAIIGNGGKPVKNMTGGAVTLPSDLCEMVAIGSIAALSFLGEELYIDTKPKKEATNEDLGL